MNQSGSYGWFAFLQNFISYQPLVRGKVKLLLRFLQKISPNQSGSYGWFAPLLCFISYQPLVRGKVKLSFAVFAKD
ncbi:hypothetical protein [Bacillus thuringiensis]|uniref:hypothetical protein n=1 Tax=Bacillus thuringiensis TaxID=1428 RepID=UPI001E2E834C|nr:hypothetical protein [Bacillus thuringiensis]